MPVFPVELSEEIINALAHRYGEVLSPAELLQLVALRAVSQDGIVLESAWRWLRPGEETKEGDEMRTDKSWAPAAVGYRVGFSHTHRRRLL